MLKSHIIMTHIFYIIINTIKLNNIAVIIVKNINKILVLRLF